MFKTPSLTELLEAGVHFGHQASRWHPKMAPFIFGVKSGIHIVNVEETKKRLEIALEFVKGIVARGGNVLFVGTKQQARGFVKKYAIEAGMPYVNERWLGGTLTNFVEIKRVVKRLIDLKDQTAKGELKKYTKKEQIWIARDIEDMERKVGGIQTMMQVPDALFIVDVRAEKTALAEAIGKKIPVIAMVDTNVNPRDVAYPIPANDDGSKSIELILSFVAEAIKEGRAHGVAMAAEAMKEKEEEKPEVEEQVIASAKEEVAVLDEKLTEERAKLAQEEKK
ncbi:MAG: 30S ribosomal protein S2 [Patescibacteria group bacterium]